MQKVIVVDHDPSWPDIFERLRGGIWPSVAGVAISIEHVGSTSVRGLAAKPIIDMTIVVPGADAVRTVIERLAEIGYRHRGDLGVPGARHLTAPPIRRSIICMPVFWGMKACGIIWRCGIICRAIRWRRRSTAS